MQFGQFNQRKHLLMAGLVMMTLAVPAWGQSTRFTSSSRDATTNQRFEDILEGDSRNPRDPGLSRSGNRDLYAPAEVDLRNVDRTALVNLLREAVQETERLYRAVRREADRYRELNQSLSDLKRLRNGGAYILQDLEDNRSLEGLLPDIRQMSIQWNLISHQLGRSARLDNSSRDIIDRIDRLGQQMEKMFRLEPQLDRRALVNELAMLLSSVNHLLDELRYLPGAAGNDNLIYDARRLGQQIRQIEDVVLDGDSHSEIVDSYRRFSSMWTALLEDLRPLDDRHIRREIRTIVEADSNIHDLLWLDQPANREHLRQLANALMKNVDEFYNRTPLRLIVQLDNAETALENAETFLGVVENFKQNVDRQESEASLVEDYEFVEDYGRKFVHAFSKMRSRTGLVVLKVIDDNIASIRSELHLSGTVTSVDTQEMAESAARLENLADHLREDVRDWLNRDRQSFRDDALQAVNRFVGRTRRLHRGLQDHATMNELRAETKDLGASWVSVLDYLKRCRTQDRAHLAVLARQVADTIYELEQPLSL